MGKQESNPDTPVSGHSGKTGNFDGETQMQTKQSGKVIIKIHVPLVSIFIKTFEQQKEQRQIDGEQSCSICREHGEFNHFTVICDWDSYENAKCYWKSEQGQKDIKQWHNVRGDPDIQILIETKFD